jgi:hypothetical protein
MTIERAFRVVHLLDVPESKRKFWPQWASVVVNRDGVVEDVIQHFDAPDLSSNRQHLEFYPHSTQFTTKAGEMYLTLDEFRRKIQDCVDVWDWEKEQRNEA